MNQIHANARLSGRETEVMRLLGDGKTTAEIAAKLKISMKTVQEYCGRLKKKEGKDTPITHRREKIPKTGGECPNRALPIIDIAAPMPHGSWLPFTGHLG